MQPIVSLVFHNLPSLYPLSYTCYNAFWLCQCNIGAKKRFALYMQLSIPSAYFLFVMQHAGIELGPHCYDATLLSYATLAGHKPHIIITCVRAALAK